jgi:hypothetical protein
MKCYHCEADARGVCTFCGRALCKAHMKKMPAIITIYIGEGETPKAVVVADAINCGVCKPQPEPIEMPELY